MDSLTVGVSRTTHGMLKDLADSSGDTITNIVDRAVRDYQRRQFWADYEAAYAAVMADPETSTSFQGEVDLWDGASSDGLEGMSDGSDPGPAPGRRGDGPTRPDAGA